LENGDFTSDEIAGSEWEKGKQERATLKGTPQDSAVSLPECKKKKKKGERNRKGKSRK